MKKFNVARSYVATAIVSLLLLPFSAVAADGDQGKTGSLLMAQLTQFNGGCPPNECANIQFSIHRAPVCPNGPDTSVSDTYSVSMVREVGDAPPLRGGSSTLVRAGDGVAFDFATSGLAPNAPYTIWYVAFNPDNPCISDSLDCNCAGGSLRDAEDGVIYAGGAMSDVLGNVSFAGHINHGELPQGEDQVSARFDAPIEPGAEVHLVVRGHGRALRGRTPEE